MYMHTHAYRRCVGTFAIRGHNDLTATCKLFREVEFSSLTGYDSEMNYKQMTKNHVRLLFIVDLG